MLGFYSCKYSIELFQDRTVSLIIKPLGGDSNKTEHQSMIMDVFCSNYGYKIITLNNRTHIPVNKEDNLPAILSLLDFFSGYNNTYHLEYSERGRKVSIPMDYTFSAHTGRTYFLEAVRFDQRVVDSFQFSTEFLFVFYDGDQHPLHVSRYF